MSGGPWEEEGRGKGSWLWRVRIYGWVSGREQRILTACDWRCQHRGNTQNKKNLWNKIYRSLEGRLKEQQNQQRCQQHHFWAWDPSIFIYFFFFFSWGAPGITRLRCCKDVRRLGGGSPLPLFSLQAQCKPPKAPQRVFSVNCSTNEDGSGFRVWNPPFELQSCHSLAGSPLANDWTSLSITFSPKLSGSPINHEVQLFFLQEETILSARKRGKVIIES